jgi:hypothetical protein
MKQTFRTILMSSALATLAGPALAAQMSFYSADLVELNNSGVSGTVFLTFDRSGENGMRSLLVEAAIKGLKPGAHAAHIHGFSGDDRKASIAPTDDIFMPDVESVDTGGIAGASSDGDGFTELSEGAPFYGGILQTLTGLEADGGGRAFYDQAFEIAEGGELDDDLFSLDNREVVVHGMDTFFQPINAVEGLGGDIDGSTPADRNFNALLPVATAKFESYTPEMEAPSPVPLPAAVWMLLAGVGGLGAIGRFRRKG